ncbi:MAG: outer membrane lipoprotein-sorting protein [Nitrospirae bacterium YQR-1]
MIKKLIILLIIILPLDVFALTPEEIVKESQAVFFYKGQDFKTRVSMKLIGGSGQGRIRELTMIRKNYGDTGGQQKIFMYFFQPADVKDMTFMVYKYPAKDDDRWLFIPAVNMVKRISAQDKHSSFAGSDFTYEDISGRDVEDDTHEIKEAGRTLPIGNENRDCFVIKSTPRFPGGDYSYKLSYIDKDTFVPLKEEYFDRKGELYKIYTADEIKIIDGFPTVIKRTMKNLSSGHKTEVVLTKTNYNIGIEDNLFSERYLKQPPQKLIE